MTAYRRDEGQAAVELALGLPLVMVVLLAVAQVVLVARDQLAVVHAAREAARAASLAGATAEDGVAAGQAAAGLPVEVRIQLDDTTARAWVSARSATDVPLVGALIGDRTVTAEAVVRREP